MIETYMYKLVELVVDIVEANTLLIFVGIFTAKDNLITKWRQVFCCAFGCGVACFLLDQIALLSLFKTLGLMFIYCVLIVYILQVKWKKALFWVIIYVAFSLILELFIMFCIQFFIGSNLNVFLEWGQERIFMIVTVKIISAFIIFLLYKFCGEKRKLFFYGKFEKVIMIICIVIIIMLCFFGSYSFTGRYAEIVTFSFLLLSAGTILFLIYTLFSVTEKLESQQQLELVQMQNKVLEQSLTETQNVFAHWQKQIHDYKNTVVCLSSMLKSSDNASVKAYLDKELEQINRADHIISCGNTMMDAIFNLKWLEAERRHIFFSVQGGIPNELQIEEIELGRIMGNLLDNAIEGAEYSKTQPYVEVILNQSEEGLTIEITNSAGSEPIDFNKTSKENRGMHGIGLQSVREIVKENGGIFEILQLGNRVTARVEFWKLDSDLS